MIGKLGYSTGGAKNKNFQFFRETTSGALILNLKMEVLEGSEKFILSKLSSIA